MPGCAKMFRAGDGGTNFYKQSCKSKVCKPRHRGGRREKYSRLSTWPPIRWLTVNIHMYIDPLANEKLITAHNQES